MNDDTTSEEYSPKELKGVSHKQTMLLEEDSGNVAKQHGGFTNSATWPRVGQLSISASSTPSSEKRYCLFVNQQRPRVLISLVLHRVQNQVLRRRSYACDPIQTG